MTKHCLALPAVPAVLILLLTISLIAYAVTNPGSDEQSASEAAPASAAVAKADIPNVEPTQDTEHRVEGMEAPVWNKGAERLIFKARCMRRSGHYSIEPNGSISCTVDTYERKFPSPDIQWSISDLGILYAGDELVRDLLEDSWFEKESQDVVWEPNSSGAFLYKSNKLFYLAIPDGAPILIDDTGYISYGAHWFGVAE